MQMKKSQEGDVLKGAVESVSDNSLNKIPNHTDCKKNTNLKYREVQTRTVLQESMIHRIQNRKYN